MSEVLIIRRKRTAEILGVSPSQVLKYERQGLITRINLPGIRRVGHSAAQVHDLARSLIAAAKTHDLRA